MMSLRRSYYIVNGISIYRIAAAPLLVLLLLLHETDVFKWLLLLSFLTDALDGYLARKYRVTSIMGARLDSIGDDLTILVSILAMLMLKMDFIKTEIVTISIMLALYFGQNVVALIRYGQITSFHTWLAKAATILQAGFLVSAFFVSTPLYVIFYPAAYVTIVELIEELIMVFMLPVWKEDVRGLSQALRLKREMEHGV